MGHASAALRKGIEGTAPLSNRLRSLSASDALQAATLPPQYPQLLHFLSKDQKSEKTKICLALTRMPHPL